MTDPFLILGALMLEAVVGYPDAMHRRVPHPVTWIGRALTELEQRWNTEAHNRKLRGIVTLVIVAGAAGAVGSVIEHLAPPMIVVVIATVGLAQRSLYQHVTAVLRPLQSGDVVAARGALAFIVGRDVHDLDETSVAAAGLETLSESFNDGIVAPAFWFLIGGLPGLFIYKAVNTADSVIGHMEPRWRDFGWAAARTDDVMNWIPARLAGAMIAVAGWGGWRTMWADARKHASPNAGWPEAAMAGALNVTLGGPASYDGVVHPRAVFGSGARPAAADLGRGLHLYMYACGSLWALLALGGVAWPR